MKIKVETTNAPSAIGPYSQAIVANGSVYVSGQLPIDPTSGTLVSGSIEEQTKQCLENIKAILKEAGSDMNKIVKTTIFVTNMEDFPKVNAAYAEIIPHIYPARACVQVAELPKSAPIEIECIAVL